MDEIQDIPCTALVLLPRLLPHVSDELVTQHDACIRPLSLNSQNLLNSPISALVAHRRAVCVQVDITVKSLFERSLAANSILISIPVPPQTAKVTIKKTKGDAKYDGAGGVIRWSISKFSGHKEHSLSAEVLLVATTREKKPWSKCVVPSPCFVFLYLLVHCSMFVVRMRRLRLGTSVAPPCIRFTIACCACSPAPVLGLSSLFVREASQEVADWSFAMCSPNFATCHSLESDILGAITGSSCTRPARTPCSGLSWLIVCAPHLC